MPRVATAVFTIKGERHEFGISYSTKDKFYLNGFPSELKNVVDSSFTRESLKPPKFETEAELRNYYSVLIDKYHEIISKTKKVIIYHLSAPERFQELDGIPKEMAKKIGYAGGIGENIFGFTIEYQVLFQKTDDGVQYFKVNTDGSVGYQESVPTHLITIIDYTEEREVFFENIKKNMEALFLKVINVMGDGEAFSLMIDKGLKLLS